MVLDQIGPGPGNDGVAADGASGGATTAPERQLAARAHLASLGLPTRDLGELPSSLKRFGDGAQYRVEIPSVEGPEPFAAILEAAGERAVPIHRISQGSGIMLLTDAEIGRMLALAAPGGVEVCLFVGPRAAWDVGIQVTTLSGRVAGAVLRGTEQLAYAIEDVVHACELGVRSVLVADIGQLSALGRLRSAGDLPADLILKTSVSFPTTNPATARLLEDLGANTLNLPLDLSLAQIASIRQAVDVPLDIYVEGADDFGGTVRYYEVPEIVRVAAPVYLKFTVRNAPGLYPSGRHLANLAVETARERVRRAEIGLAMLARYSPGAVTSRPAVPKGT